MLHLYYEQRGVRFSDNERVETALRSQHDLWLDRDNLIETLNCDLEQLERMKNDPNRMDEILSFQLPAEPRANIIYSQMFSPGFSEELLDRISNIRFCYPNYPKKALHIMGLNFRSEIHLSIHQCSRDDRLIHALAEILRERGLTHSLSSHKPDASFRCTGYAGLRRKRMSEGEP